MIEITALIYKGKLFQVGDVITNKTEYLGSTGFSHYHGIGTLKKIIIKEDTLSNSLYLNHGFTYNTIGGLGYVFMFENGNKEYAFECDLVPLPSDGRKAERFINEYYRNSININKYTDIVKYFEIPEKYSKNIGSFLKKNHKWAYDYLCLTFNIRNGYFGRIEDANQLSNITMKVLRENGFDNNTMNNIHLFTSNNSMTEGNKRYKMITPILSETQDSAK